jgi:uncharacterized membrane protein
MHYTIPILFILFIIYSFLGWAFETILCSVDQKRIVDRGFLIGPICPIYGVASIIGIFLLKSYFEDPLILFILSAILATFIEYITSYLLEKLFKIRWWDYTNEPFNLNGRIVLHNSIIFGLIGLSIVYTLNPIIVNLLTDFSVNILTLISLIFLVLFVIDLIITSNVLLSIRQDTKEMLKDRTEEVSLIIKNKLSKQILLTKRLLNAFPNLKPIHKNLKLQKKISNLLNKKRS